MIDNTLGEYNLVSTDGMGEKYQRILFENLGGWVSHRLFV